MMQAHTVDYSALKKRENLVMSKRMNLLVHCAKQSKQFQDKHCLTYLSEISKIVELLESSKCSCQGLEGRGEVFNGCTVPVVQDEAR